MKSLQRRVAREDEHVQMVAVHIQDDIPEQMVAVHIQNDIPGGGGAYPG